jgi:hypothetical protein
MVNNTQIRGVISYLIRLTHTSGAFRFKFVNFDVFKKIKGQQSYPEIHYDLEITSKQSDIPYLWDFFHCKSTHIVQDGCEMVGLDWKDFFNKVKDIYYNGEKINRYGGDIPQSFINEISNEIQELGLKQINTNFFCGGERKTLTLKVNYEVSDIYIDDGITTDVSVYCHQALVDGEPLENIPQDLAETIVGYMSEDDNLRIPLDDIVWTEITKYMNLGDCEIWTHTYTYLRNIGDVEVNDFNYINQSTFSSKMCDFMTGDY